MDSKLIRFTMNTGSMEPLIRARDKIIVNPDLSLKDGNIVIVKFHDHFIIGRLAREKGAAVLVPENSQYAARYFNPDSARDLRYYGTVVEVRRKTR